MRSHGAAVAGGMGHLWLRRRVDDDAVVAPRHDAGRFAPMGAGLRACQAAFGLSAFVDLGLQSLVQAQVQDALRNKLELRE